MDDWILVRRKHISYYPGETNLALLDVDLPYGRTAYLHRDISKWMINNDVKIESRIHLPFDDIIIKFENPEDRLYFIMRFEE